MNTTTMNEEFDRQEFALEAAACFAKNPDIVTYGKLEAGSLLAIRWGLMDRGVLVVKLDDSYSITNYADLVKEVQDA